jgi:protein phosphatase
MDLFWSDPTPNEEMLGLLPNHVRDPLKQNNITTYGTDIVDKFLKMNQLQVMIRSHQVCMDGIDNRFGNGQCMTIFSATNYCGSYHNDAAFLVI